MILYKYYNFKAGLSALRSRKVGFRDPNCFNDPFELSYFSNATGPDNTVNTLIWLISELKKTVAVLSLSKNPANPLMWSHYGDEHTGFVIGYDVDNKFFNDREYNIITADDGDVLYTNTKTLNKLDKEYMENFRNAFFIGSGIEVDESTLKKHQVQNILKKTLLTKCASWVYEEEVRIVKLPQSKGCLPEEYQIDPLRSFSCIGIDVAPKIGVVMIPGLHIYNHQVNIREVYLGARNPLLKNDKKSTSNSDNTIVDYAIQFGWDVKSLSLSQNSWNLESNEVTPDILLVPSKTKGLINNLTFDSKEAEHLKQSLSKITVMPNDKFELTNWYGKQYLKRNGTFI